MKKTVFVKKATRRYKKIDKILAKVKEIAEYAIDNLCTQDSQFEELEMILNDCIK